jgi:HD-GYP domain-containing protein (c-di-GMP phosphodiesterase class II)
VKVAKLGDIYDAMTSKRCYKLALNAMTGFTEILKRLLPVGSIPWEK